MQLLDSGPCVFVLLDARLLLDSAPLFFFLQESTLEAPDCFSAKASFVLCQDDGGTSEDSSSHRRFAQVLGSLRRGAAFANRGKETELTSEWRFTLTVIW